MEYSENMLKEYLKRHMMRSVSERYAFLFLIGMEARFVGQMDMSGCPDIVAAMLVRHWKNYDSRGEMLRQMYDIVVKIPLPKGIPVPVN